MNGLSWLLYWADVAGDLDWFLAFITVVSCFVFLFTMLALMAVTDGDGWSDDGWRLWRKFAFWSGLAASVGFVTGALVPSQSTIYAIAASEMGEEIAKTETAGKAVTALNNWLDRQLEPEEKINAD